MLATSDKCLECHHGLLCVALQARHLCHHRRNRQQSQLPFYCNPCSAEAVSDNGLFCLHGLQCLQCTSRFSRASSLDQHAIVPTLLARSQTPYDTMPQTNASNVIMVFAVLCTSGSSSVSSLKQEAERSSILHLFSKQLQDACYL